MVNFARGGQFISSLPCIIVQNSLGMIGIKDNSVIQSLRKLIWSCFLYKLRAVVIDESSCLFCESSLEPVPKPVI